jgi:hypothetical protein
MSPISQLFEKNSSQTNQNPVTSVDKLVCAFDRVNIYYINYLILGDSEPYEELLEIKVAAPV